MSDEQKVVFLAFRNNAPTAASEEVVACSGCQNKTWKAVYAPNSDFPMLRCACCGATAGRFGWVSDDHE
jgi:hypothetical protein